MLPLEVAVILGLIYLAVVVAKGFNSRAMRRLDLREKETKLVLAALQGQDAVIARHVLDAVGSRVDPALRSSLEEHVADLTIQESHKVRL